MAGHLQVLLAGIAAGPGRPVGGIELAPRAERDRVLAAWNDTGPAASRPARSRRLFAAAGGAAPRTRPRWCVRGTAELRRAGQRAPASWPATWPPPGVRPEDRSIALALPRTADHGHRRSWASP